MVNMFAFGSEIIRLIAPSQRGGGHGSEHQRKYPNVAQRSVLSEAVARMGSLTPEKNVSDKLSHF